ncbi:hypothetical protein [Actinocrispum wychmicini]|nr:hypothetical protein [Actinocrispum wychmicini]
MSRSRGRKLRLRPLPLAAAPDLPCGMWIALPDTDYVFYAKGASALHQQNIILHEIGHLLCDHSLHDGSADLTALFSHLDPEKVRQVLLRSRYSTPQEQEAEMVAALILEEAGWSPGTALPYGALGKLTIAFGLPRRGTQ